LNPSKKPEFKEGEIIKIDAKNASAADALRASLFSDDDDDDDDDGGDDGSFSDKVASAVTPVIDDVPVACRSAGESEGENDVAAAVDDRDRDQDGNNDDVDGSKAPCSLNQSSLFCRDCSYCHFSLIQN
jgi:hypothetical protein